jgi:hypothetical protein
MDRRLEAPGHACRRRVRIRRADFDALLEASVIGAPLPAAPSIWDGDIPAPVVASEG